MYLPHRYSNPSEKEKDMTVEKNAQFEEKDITGEEDAQFDDTTENNCTYPSSRGTLDGSTNISSGTLDGTTHISSIDDLFSTVSPGGHERSDPMTMPSTFQTQRATLAEQTFHQKVLTCLADLCKSTAANTLAISELKTIITNNSLSDSGKSILLPRHSTPVKNYPGL